MREETSEQGRFSGCGGAASDAGAAGPIPGAWHHAYPADLGGALRILNVAVPAFDPRDEWVDA
ncbi:MAG: hypothetical protein HY332_23730 [Chloroflexi bacterium]|nr:hypothetical protein [Chloroflexota bacterium]